MNRAIIGWDDNAKKEWLREHFLYEVETLDFSVEELIRHSKSKNLSHNISMLIRNTFLDNCIIHARNLVEFFYAGKVLHRDSVLATDFVGDQKWEQSIRPRQTHWIRRIKRLASQYVAHLTTTRKEFPCREGWNCLIIRKDLSRVILRFLDNIPDNYYNAEFDNIKAWCRKTVGNHSRTGVCKTTVDYDYFQKW